MEFGDAEIKHEKQEKRPDSQSKLARVRQLFSDTWDIIGEPQDDEAWMVEQPEEAKSPWLSKVTHPRRSVREVLHGFTRGAGLTAGMTEEERLKLRELDLDYQEEALFRGIGESIIERPADDARD